MESDLNESRETGAMNNHLKRYKIWEYSLLAIILLLIGTILIASVYSWPGADDFSHVNDWNSFQGSYVSYIVGWYMNYRGVYLTSAIQGFFSAWIQPENSWMYGGTMLVCTVLFFAAFGALYHTIAQRIRLSTIMERGIFLLILFPFLNLRIYPEIFYWLSGACSYSLPIVIAMAGMSLLLKNNKGWKRTVGLGCIFIVGGGSLQVAACMCWGLLCIALYQTINYQRQTEESVKHEINYRRVWSPFICAVVGTMVNVAAPGNFATEGHELSGALSSLIKTIWFSFRMYLEKTKIMFVDKYFLVFVIIAVLIGIRWEVKIRSRNVWMIAIFAAGAVYTAIFPVAYAYEMQRIEFMPNRTLFLVDLVYIAGWIAFAVVLGNVIGQRANLRADTGLIITWCMAAICMLCIKGADSSQYMTLLTTKHLMQHKIQSYSASVYQVYHEITESEEENVTVQFHGIRPETVANFSLEKDPEDWINQALAKYFEKTTISAQ